MGSDKGKGSDRPVPKGNLERWIKGVAANDKRFGRDSKDNPNNKRNGKW